MFNIPTDYRELKMSNVRGIIHVVSDLSAMIKFYTDVMEFVFVEKYELSGESFDALFQLPKCRAMLAKLRLGDQFTYLIEFDQKHPEPYIHGSQSNDLWFQHIAIVVSDMQKAHAKLIKHGIQSISHSPQTIPESNVAAAGVKAFYFRSPDGHPLELIYFPKGKGSSVWQNQKSLFLGIDHTAIAVSSTEASLEFYQDLGMKIVGGSLNYGEEQELLSSVVGAKVKITNLQFPESKGIGIELLEYLNPLGGRKRPTEMQANHPIENATLIEVKDLSKFAKKATSVKGLGEFREGAIITDPDGHRLLFVQK